MHLPCLPLIIPTCLHAATILLLPTTTLTIVAAPQDTTAHPATLEFICAVMTITIMISAYINHLMLELASTILSTRTSTLPENPTLTLQDVILSVHQRNSMKSCHILMALIILPGTLIQMKSLIIPFILTVMEIVKIPLLLLILQLIWMNLAKHLTSAESPWPP